MSKRICFFAGPGAGKSTTATWLFSELKVKGYSVELVTEYVKAWATEKRKVKAFDQIYLLGKQMQYEYRFLAAGVQNIITDSPILLSCSYAEFYNPDLGIHEPMLELAAAYEKEFPSINIFLNRGDKKYVEHGRYQTESQALELDEIIRGNLVSSNISFEDFSFYDREGILGFVEERINPEGFRVK